MPFEHFFENVKTIFRTGYDKRIVERVHWKFKCLQGSKFAYNEETMTTKLIKFRPILKIVDQNGPGQSKIFNDQLSLEDAEQLLRTRKDEEVRQYLYFTHHFPNMNKFAKNSDYFSSEEELLEKKKQLMDTLDVQLLIEEVQFYKVQEI